MYSKFLGISAGFAMGVALFVAPASATLVLESDGLTGVGSVDLLLGACNSTPGLTAELECLNDVVVGHSWTESSALKMDDLTDEFLKVTDTDGFDDSIWAVELEKQGGWFLIKTGNISCTEASQSFFVVGDSCDTVNDDQYFMVFENLSELMYAVFSLDGLAADGFLLANIEKISHITIVPLPAAALLFGSTLLGGGLIRRRKMIKKYGLPV